MWVLSATLTAISFVRGASPVEGNSFSLLCVMGGNLCPLIFWLSHYLVTGSLKLADPNGAPWSLVVTLSVMFIAIVWPIGVARWGKAAHSQVKRKFWVQSVLGSLVIVYWVIYYAALAYFMAYGSNNNMTANEHGWEQPVMYVLFIMLNNFLQWVGKRLGVAIDAGKSGTFSLYFVLEFTARWS